jgi:hypothetical protein
MGDMADYYIDLGIEQLCKDDLDIRDHVDHKKFRPDDNDEDENDGYTLRSKIKTCGTCGEKNLHWESTGSGWRLFYPDGTIHNCYNKSVTEFVSHGKRNTKTPLIGKVVLGRRNLYKSSTIPGELIVISNWNEVKEFVKVNSTPLTHILVKPMNDNGVIRWSVSCKTKSL